MAQSPIQAAITQICQEKNLSEEAVLHTIELALAAAYRKDFGNKMQNIITEFDPKTGDVKVVDFKTVVEDLPEEELDAIHLEIKKKEALEKERPEVYINSNSFVSSDDADENEVKRFNPKTEIQLKDAKEIDKQYKIGDEIITTLEVPGEFGRMAAQTAKQVIIQKIREVERQNIFEEFKDLEQQVVSGTVQRREGRNILIDLGTTTALMPSEEQVVNERYNIGNKLKVYIKAVEQTTRGPQIVVSRASTEIVNKIFELEIPEIANNAIEIKSIAREAGNRSKVAISTNDDSIDPIGSCVGQRGARIQTIISELNGEKVDIILFDEDPIKFIINALSPAKVVSVKLKEGDTEKSAIVNVAEDQLSLAIGRGGQNVRLASKLTDWKIDIIADTSKSSPEVKIDESVDDEDTKTSKEDKKEKKEEEKKEDVELTDTETTDLPAQTGASKEEKEVKEKKAKTKSTAKKTKKETVAEETEPSKEIEEEIKEEKK